MTRSPTWSVISASGSVYRRRPSTLRSAFSANDVDALGPRGDAEVVDARVVEQGRHQREIAVGRAEQRRAPVGVLGDGVPDRAAASVRRRGSQSGGSVGVMMSPVSASP